MNGDLWDKFTLRAKSYAYQNLRGRGMAIMDLRLVFVNGELVNWAEPTAKCFEPGAECTALLNALQGARDV